MKGLFKVHVFSNACPPRLRANFMTTDDLSMNCAGWWQQDEFGRQPMNNLRLRFDGGAISGSGYDIIGLFRFAGTITQQGHVAMVKQYLGQHAVDYVGTYDGEGVLFGDWRVGYSSGKWLIKIKGSRAAEYEQAIAEIG
jgi:hypothetical protein